MKKGQWKVYMGIFAAMLAINVIAWNSKAFCDWYISHIFPLWVNTYGRLTGLFPFSVGEIMLFIGILLLAGAVLSGCIWGVAGITAGRTGRLKGCRRVTSRFNRISAWIGLGICVVMTLNCFILYHASTFSEKYFGKEKEVCTYEELLAVRNYVVKKCNELSQQMERDEAGRVLYKGDMKAEAIHSMRKLGDIYGGLSGYYPNPKPLLFSDFFSQQYMGGYYFPFSMEANYNATMYIMNKPATFCHELAHLKGYIFEDEANFIGYLGCIQSDDKVFNYSGYLSVLYYLDNDFYEAVGEQRDAYLAEERILPQVHADNVFLLPEEWDRVEEKAILDTEVVDAVSDSFTDTTLVLNGVSDGIQSYNRVVRLLLQYYESTTFSEGEAGD